MNVLGSGLTRAHHFVTLQGQHVWVAYHLLLIKAPQKLWFGMSVLNILLKKELRRHYLPQPKAMREHWSHEQAGQLLKVCDQYKRDCWKFVLIQKSAA